MSLVLQIHYKNVKNTTVNDSLEDTRKVSQLEKTIWRKRGNLYLFLYKD